MVVGLEGEDDASAGLSPADASRVGQGGRALDRGVDVGQ
jgi:hypothetical protein